MEYITVQEAAEKWDLSDRTVQHFCKQGRIPGARKFGKSWAIPAAAERPLDPRLGSGASPEAEEPLTGLTLMPLMNTPFPPGQCLAAVEAMAEGAEREIARAEYHYFSGHPDRAAQEAELWLTSDNPGARLSACLIYAYANLSLGRIPGLP